MTILAHANRGNVAVICWNTLTAPTWYVTTEDLDGKVSLGAGADAKSLLEINFSEFTHEDSTAVGKLKEVEATVSNTPARDTSIGDRQIVLSGIEADFDFKAKADIRKALREEKTYTTSNGLVAYVPEEVYSDIDSLRNKTVTVVFGEDNIVSLITVKDDTVEKEFLTKYVVADSEITVGGEKYDLADEYEVKVNDVVVEADATYELTSDTTFAAGKDYYTYDATNKVYKKATVTVGDSVTSKTYYVIATPAYDALEYALTKILGSFDKKAFDKAIEATLTIDEDEDEVTKIDLFVSGNYADFKTVETVAKKIKNEKIETVAGNITWNEDDYESKDYPRVYIDGKKAEITDIEAGDVLTILGVDTLTSKEAKDINVIYASRETVEGKVSRIKNENEIYVDGTKYMISDVKEGNAYNLTGELKDLKNNDKLSNFDSIHGEDAVLYLNILGEYVMVNSDTIDSEWTFAIVDHIYDAQEDEEDADLYSQKLRLVMMDGTTSRNYKLVLNTADYDLTNTNDQTKATKDQVIMKDTNNAPIFAYATGATLAPLKAKDGKALTGKVDENGLIAFKANADGEIDLEDVFAINTNEVAKNTDIDGYNFIKMAVDYDDINFDSKRIDYTVHVKCSDTDNDALKVVESNAGAGEIDLANVVGATAKVGDYVKEESKRFKVTSNTLLADKVEKESITWKNLITESAHKASVATLLVYEDDSTELAYVIALATPNGVTDEEYALVLDATYTTSRTDKAVMLLGVDGKEYVYEYNSGVEASLEEGMLISYTLQNGKINSVTQKVDLYDAEDAKEEDVLDILGNVKGAYKVDTVEEDYLTYTDDDSITVLANRIIDINTDDVIVVSYENDTFTTEKYDAETLEGAYVLFFNTDSDTNDYELLVIIK